MPDINFLMSAGINYSATIKRFGGNDKLFSKLLTKYFGDGYCQKVEDALATNDADAVDNAAHTLKGVAANLGLDDIARLGAEMMAAAREGDVSRAAALMPALREAEDRARAAAAEI